jgi:hypothetical protein
MERLSYENFTLKKKILLLFDNNLPRLYYHMFSYRSICPFVYLS